jgi:glycosyltransferase involved in cell wall biosynthesis
VRVLQAMAGQAYGGAEAFFERLVAALNRAGVDQRLVIRREPRRAARLRANGLEPVELPFGGKADLVTRTRLGLLIREYKPDVVLSWMSRAASLMPSRKVARDDAVRVGRLGGYYDLKYYRGCDHLVANTRDIVDHITRGGWPAERVHYIPNFVDATPALPVGRAALGTPENAVVALALGRLHPNKAFDVLLAALVQAPAIHLWLAGEGELRPALESEAEKAGLGNRVRFLGWRQDVAALLAACDLVVCPSRHEPLGNVVIEAWAHRRPVIAAASAGPAALIADNRTGLLVPVDDAAALAAALVRLAEDGTLRGRLADAGRTAYEAEYTEGAVVARYRDFFAEVHA